MIARKLRDEPLERSDPFAAGVVLQDTFRIVKPLAEGGMGEVFLAHHERLPGLFAVKVLHRDLAANDESLTRFRNEAHIMAGLRHPNIVSVVDFNVTEEGEPYLVMEYLEGRDLGDIMHERGALPTAQVGAVVRQVASALDAAHARGVVHRDLKPDNVVIVPVSGQDDLIKVIDFGVSKSLWNRRLTAEDKIIGTPQFMAPEQAQGNRDDINEAADQFALAVLTYMMLVAEPPWDGLEPLDVLYKIVHTEAPHLTDRLPWATRVDAVLQKALAKDPGQRFPGVLAFAQAFETALAEDVPGGAQPLDLYLRPVPAPARGFTAVVPIPAELRPSEQGKASAADPGSAAPTTVKIRRRAWPRLVGGLVAASLCGGGLAVAAATHRFGWPFVHMEIKQQIERLGAPLRVWDDRLPDNSP